MGKKIKRSMIFGIILFISLFSLSFIESRLSVGYGETNPLDQQVDINILGGDTNATDCPDNEVLMGDGYCLNLNTTIDDRAVAASDTNASNCPDNTMLTGDGYCLNFNVTIDDRVSAVSDTNASDCPDDTVLMGDGYCLNLNTTISDLDTSFNQTYVNINTTANIQFLLNFTNMVFAELNVTTVNATNFCIVGVCISDWSSINGTSSVGKNASGVYIYNDTLTIFSNGTALNQSFNQTPTLDLFALNVSANHTERTRATYNDTWSNTFNTTYDSNVDTNLSEWKDNVTTSACTSGQKVLSIQTNGSMTCAADNTGAGGKDTSGVYIYNDSTTIFSNGTALNQSFNQTPLVNALISSVNETTNVEALGFEAGPHTPETTPADVRGFVNISVEYVFTANDSLNFAGANSTNDTQFNIELGIFTIDLSWLLGWATSDLNSIFNQTDLVDSVNNSVEANNESTNIDSLGFLNKSGTNANQNIKIGIYNLTVNEFFGIINANYSYIALGVGSPTVNQMQEYLDNTGSSGFFLGGELSDGGLGTVDVAAGSGFIRTTNDDNAELQSFRWSASAGIAVPDDTTQYVYVNDSGQISLNQNEFLEKPNLIKIGVVTDEGATISHVFALGVRLQESVAEAGRFIRRVHGISRDVRKGGLIMGQSGDVNRDVTMTQGSLWWGRTEYIIPSFDTSGADTFNTYSASGQEDAVASQFPNTQYDNSGTLTTMSNNRWANLFFYLEPDGHVVMIYGRDQFASQALAENEDVPSTSLPSKITETSILVSRYTFQESSNTATISSAFDTLFANAGVTDHGNLAGLTDDDHTQYILGDGTRSLTGNWDQGNFNLTSLTSWFFGIVNWSSLNDIPAFVRNYTDDINSVNNSVEANNVTSNIVALNFETGPHTTDTNETPRFNNLTSLNCPGTDKAIGVHINGTIECSIDLNTGIGNTTQEIRNAINDSVEYSFTANDSLNFAGANSTNVTQFNINLGIFTIDLSWLTSWLGTKTTDDLPEGGTNLYEDGNRFNLTYDNYKTNVSRNYTSQTFDAFNSIWEMDYTNLAVTNQSNNFDGDVNITGNLNVSEGNFSISEGGAVFSIKFNGSDWLSG